MFKDLRIASAKFNDAHFNAIALGGSHENKQNMYDVIAWTIDNVAEEKPKHLLGIGEVDDIFNGVERGIDTFDCVAPSRLARAGHIFVHPPEGSVQNRFRYDIKKAIYRLSEEPLSNDCDCYVCQKYTRGYIHHLFRAKELLAYRLATYHNIYFIIHLAKKIRGALLEDNFTALKEEWIH
jgi:queuine tRNA-ribosyltransferase/7-cyano-7-deazaguanine tRNA-ribosyltransferase